jgi:hypothetical protein
VTSILALIGGIAATTGLLLLVLGHRRLYRRARELKLWPDLQDHPKQPWTIHPEWSAALYLDLVRRTQSDAEYRRGQRQVLFALALCSFAVVIALALKALPEAAEGSRGWHETDRANQRPAETYPRAQRVGSSGSTTATTFTQRKRKDLMVCPDFSGEG